LQNSGLPLHNKVLSIRHFSFRGGTADAAKVGAGINLIQKKGEKTWAQN